MPEVIKTTLETLELARILALAAISFAVAIIATPLVTHFLYKYKLGKYIRQDAPIFAKLHKHKEGTPTMGGVLIWGTLLIVISAFALLDALFENSIFSTFNFLSRRETLLPLGALVVSAFVGLADDLIGVFKIAPLGKGLRMRHRVFIYTAIAVIGAWWFFDKLDWDLIAVPYLGEFSIGIAYIPFFIFMLVATAFSVNETDGLDGLAGGVLMMAFGAFGVIAFTQGKFDLAAFTAVISGALLAFLWFNIPPARFFMGDTGAMSLGITLGIIAMLTNASLLLPLIGIVLVIESASVIVQVASKKLRGKKIFQSTPIHHHFQAIGWPESKVVMRLWIISALGVGAGLLIALTA